MSIAIIDKLIGVIAAVIGIWWFYFRFRQGTKQQLRDEYSFAKEFMEDNSENNLHPLVIEKGYQALVGKTNIAVSEISYILTLNKPSESLRHYITAKHLLAPIDTESIIQINFKKRLKTNFSRVSRKILYLLLYLIFGFLSVLPFILAKGFTSKVAFQLLLTMPLCGILAILSIRAFVEIVEGEKLINNQIAGLSHD